MISINLLPEDIRENVDFSKKNRVLLKYIKLSLLLCLLLLVSFTTCAIFLKENNDFFIGKINESKDIIKGYDPLVKKAQKLDGDTKTIQKIKNNYHYWSKFNAYLNANVPEGIYIDTLEDTSGKLKITGNARTKNDVGLFRDALERTDAFENVSVDTVRETVSQIDGKTTVNNFVMNLTLTKDATNKGPKQ